MYEVSLVFMEVDAILGLDSDCDVTTRHLFHVDIFREVPFLAIYHHEHVGMMMDLVWLRFEIIRQAYGYGDEYEREECFFHRRFITNYYPTNRLSYYSID